MRKIRVAIIAGGWSAERDISLKSGMAVYNALDRDKHDKYEVLFLDISQDLNIIFEKRYAIDIAFPLLHGKFGEDGCIQGFLKILDIPFVGSDVLSSAIAMNKKISKGIFQTMGLKVPKGISVKKSQKFSLSDIIDKIGLPLVVKPVSEGSSFGISICDNKIELTKGLADAFSYEREVLIEEYIEGREITAPIIGNEKLEVLPLIEIIPEKGHKFFDFKAKYTPGATKEICPAELSSDLVNSIEKCAKIAFISLGCKVWARVDTILKNNDIYILEVNTIPGMTENSLFPLSAMKAGISFPELLDRLISLSLDAYEQRNRS